VTVYVDMLTDYGWKLGKSCHMVTDDPTFAELHRIADAIGLRRSWFQCKPNSLWHYDLVASKRTLAIAAGAVAVDTRADWGKFISPLNRAAHAAHAKAIT
jgi:hypothetical protein